MIPSLTTMLLQSLVIFVLLVIVSASSIPNYKLEQEESASSIGDDVPTMSKAQFRREMARQLIELQQAEAQVIGRIRELEAERIALSQRKRSHYSNMCMFNVVSCYRKRK